METIPDLHSKDGPWGVHTAPPKSAWRSIFSGNDHFEWPFRQEVEICRLFYPTDGLHLTKAQYSALTGSMQEVGESGFYLSIVESQGSAFLGRNWGHWSCDLPSYEAYGELRLTLENALYSREGRWGVLISHEMHALIGGTSTFMAHLTKRYPHWAADLRLLREDWTDKANADWLKPIMDRLYYYREDP